MSENVKPELVRELCKALFPIREPGENYAESLVSSPVYHNRLRAEVVEFLSAVDALGFSVVDLNKYTPRKRLRMAKGGVRMHRRSKDNMRERVPPAALVRQRASRRQNRG